MYTCITRETFVFTVFRQVFHLILKLELCRHACRRRDQIIPTCRYGKNMPTTALVTTYSALSPVLSTNVVLCQNSAKTWPVSNIMIKPNNSIFQ